MSVIKKFIFVSVVNVMSAISIIQVINMIRHKQCIVNCESAAKPEEKTPGYLIAVLDRLAGGIHRISTYLKNRK